MTAAKQPQPITFGTCMSGNHDRCPRELARPKGQDPAQCACDCHTAPVVALTPMAPVVAIIPPEVKAPASPRSRVSVLTLTLEEAWRDIQTQHPEVPNVVVVIGPVSLHSNRTDRYGHFTTAPTWNVKAETQHEVLIAAEGLGRGARQVFRTLLHESVHASCHVRKLLDVTQRGIHNATFRREAEAFGLVTDQDPRMGTVTPDITADTAAAYAATIRRIELALTVARFAGSVNPDALARAIAFLWMAWGHGWTVSTGGEGAWGILPRARGKSRRAGENAVRLECGCGRAIRAFPSVIAQGPITCGLCGEGFGS